MKLCAYLGFDGNCREAITFYQKVFGGEIVAMMTHAASPMADQVPADWGDRIMHARLIFGDNVLMAGDGPPDCGKANGYSLSITVDTAEEAERIYSALSENATITMPLEETFWAVRFAMLTDQFGTPWMVNCEKPLPA